MVKRYVKKPVYAEAVQYNGQNFKEIYKFCSKIPEKSLNCGDYIVREDRKFKLLSEHEFDSIYDDASILDDRHYICASSLY